MDVGAIRQRIREVLQNPVPEQRRWKEKTGGKVVGCLSCMPYFVPEEILHAAGVLPVGIWGGEVPLSQADARLQTFACTMVRSSLEMGFKGIFDVCDAIVFPSTCDAFQNLSEVWTRSPISPSIGIDVVMPRQTDRASAVSYLETILRRFLLQVEKLTGKTILDGALASSIKLYNVERRLLTALDHLRAESPYLVSGRDMTELVLSATFMPKQEHSELLRGLIEGIKEGTRDKKKGDSAVRIFLAGVMPRPVEVLDILENAGARIVGDRLGMGSLYYNLEVPEHGDPIKALAQGYLTYPPCSTIHKAAGSRADDLIAQVNRTHAHAVVILGMKFCEPEFFDYPDLRERLEHAGIPTLVVETELGMSSMGPVKTRIEAFLETLRAHREARG